MVVIPPQPSYEGYTIFVYTDSYNRQIDKYAVGATSPIYAWLIATNVGVAPDHALRLPND